VDPSRQLVTKVFVESRAAVGAVPQDTACGAVIQDAYEVHQKTISWVPSLAQHCQRFVILDMEVRSN
jgi:hypothetical protein